MIRVITGNITRGGTQNPYNQQRQNPSCMIRHEAIKFKSKAMMGPDRSTGASLSSILSRLPHMQLEHMVKTFTVDISHKSACLLDHMCILCAANPSLAHVFVRPVR